MIPDRAGADTRVDVTIPLRDLLEMDGASIIEDTWLRARAGEHGYLSGPDAEAISCDAMIVPVVTGSPDWDLITEMIPLVTDAYGHAQPADAPSQAGSRGPAPARARSRCPEAWEALQYALARRAIRFVSGPGALASALRRSLLDKPLNTKSAILDVGYADTIPDAIRKAVIARDKGCASPGGCHRRPAHCDVHHVKHKRHGGKTSTTDCVLLCQYHHDICVHRLGWDLELLPDGSTRATSPDRKFSPPQPRTTTSNPTHHQLTQRPALNVTPATGNPYRPRAPARPDTTAPPSPAANPDSQLIGTMNTADRSIALIDATMRRRFHFVPFFPHDGMMKDLLRHWLEDGNGRTAVADFLDAVNQELLPLVGEHLLIGPSHFMKADLSEKSLKRIWTYNVFPMIEEQLWGDRHQIDHWRWEQVSARYGAVLAGKGQVEDLAAGSFSTDD